MPTENTMEPESRVMMRSSHGADGSSLTLPLHVLLTSITSCTSIAVHFSDCTFWITLKDVRMRPSTMQERTLNSLPRESAMVSSTGAFAIAAANASPTACAMSGSMS